jgi:hypothetical protein
VACYFAEQVRYRAAWLRADDLYFPVAALEVLLAHRDDGQCVARYKVCGRQVNYAFNRDTLKQDVLV